ncbi:unnamed protein product [Blepharisma stoltei]|uniref:Uncharacterized protein n=1 Tax=Blepharisma stoltei TaxID=1481888 RepID=A0AAU9K4Q7_9CILI|nr:unnamed protein product [Blepharisma stoltei]
MVLCMLLFYLWPWFTLFFVVYHLIFSTWWALSVSIGIAISLLNLEIMMNMDKWINNRFIQLLLLCFSISVSYSLFNDFLHEGPEKIFEQVKQNLINFNLT